MNREINKSVIHSVISRIMIRHSCESRNPGKHWIPGQARNDKKEKTYVVLYNKKEKKSRKRGFLWLGFAGLLFAMMSYFFFQYPHRSIGPRQPIFFSHRVHAGVKEIDCRFCHSFTSRSQNAGIPTVEKCFYCHRYIIPLHPQILKEREHYDKKRPVPWVRIYFVPDYVYFHHRPHMRAEIDCTECHGDVRSMDRLVPVNFKMGFCIECHRKLKAQLDCWLACHR